MSLEKIESRYDPENDMHYTGPLVTWAEYELYLSIQDLVRRVERLEQENKFLKQKAE